MYRADWPPSDAWAEATGTLPFGVRARYAPGMSRLPIVDACHGDPTLLVLAEAALFRPGLRAKLASAEFAGADALPDSAFAWPEERRFAIHSEVDTLASIVYRAKVASAVPPHVDAALERAVRAWAIDPGVLRTATDVPAIPKVASAHKPLEYAVPSQMRLPLGSALQVKVAEEVLLRDGLTALPYLELTAGAKKIASAAAEFDLLPDPSLRRLAGDGACDVPTLCEHLHGRSAFVKTAAAQMAYDTLGRAVERHARNGARVVYDTVELEKIAHALHRLDVEHDVASSYGPRVLDPMRAVFNTTFTTKLAAADREMITLAGQGVPLAALYRIDEEGWRDLGLEDCAPLASGRSGRELGMHLRTLPKDFQKQVADAASAAP